MGVLLEPDVKAALSAAGVAVPDGVVARTPHEVRIAAARYDAGAVVKALVPIGRKQKGGGIRFVDDAAAAADHAADLIGSEINGFPVHAVLVEERVDVGSELYAAISPDGAERSWRLTFATSGGIDVEDELSAGAFVSVVLAASGRVPEFSMRELVVGAGLSGAPVRTVAMALTRTARVAISLDATLMEINPLVLTHDGRAVAVGAMCSVDDRSLFRHDDLAKQVVQGVDRTGRPLTDLERYMARLNERFPQHGEIRFAEFRDGDLGFMVMGGGAGLVSLDELHRLGRRPATFFDMTAGDVEEKIYLATRAVLGIPRLRGLIIGVNISAFAPVPIRARGIARALSETDRDLRKFPVVIRLAGPQDDEAAEILRDFPVHYFRDDATLEEAVRTFVNLVDGVA